MIQGEALPGMPAAGEGKDVMKDLTWMFLGFNARAMTYPEQAFNNSQNPFFPLEVMQGAQKIRDIADEVLLLTTTTTTTSIH